MPSTHDARPRSPRAATSDRRGVSPLGKLLVLAALAAGLAPAPAARARTFDVPCDPLALANARIATSGNGEEDVLWLAPGCTYALIDSWIASPDGGHPVTIHGRGATLDGQNLRRTVIVPAGAVLYLNDLRLVRGATTNDGGAIHNFGEITLTRTSVSESRAAKGGGIFNGENGSLTLVASTVAGNVAQDGGGILNQKGRLTLIGSTVAGNEAQGQDGWGGGIYNGRQGSRATITNSTISGNEARFGAGVFNDEAVMVVSQSTLSRNVIRDGGNGGAVYYRNYFGMGKLKLGNTILGESTYEAGGGYDCARDPYSDATAITASGGNLVADASCPIAGSISGDPQLGPLAGTPAYHPLLPGSPAVDAGQNPRCTGADQRGAARPRDGNGDGAPVCDLGAYEAP